MLDEDSDDQKDGCNDDEPELFLQTVLVMMMLMRTTFAVLVFVLMFMRMCHIFALLIFFDCKDTAHFLQLGCKLLITLKDRVNRLLRKLLCKEADDPDDRESTHHCDSTAVDRIDGITGQHIDHRQTDAPDEASPYGGCGDTLGVETQHKRCEEGTSQRIPRDTHQLGDERRRIQGDEQ